MRNLRPQQSEANHLMSVSISTEGGARVWTHATQPQHCSSGKVRTHWLEDQKGRLHRRAFRDVMSQGMNRCFQASETRMLGRGSRIWIGLKVLSTKSAVEHSKWIISGIFLYTETHLTAGLEFKETNKGRAMPRTRHIRKLFIPMPKRSERETAQDHME